MKPIHTVLALGIALATLAGCQKPEGPAERTGKEIDKTMEQAGQQIEKAGSKIQDTARGDKK